MKYIKMTTMLFIFLTFISTTKTILPKDGELDPTFGQGGITTASLYSQGSSEINSIAIQDDGKILAAGYTTINETFFRFSIVRYNTDGTMDNTFGTNGIVNTNIGDIAFANSIALQNDEKIIVAGTALLNGENKFAVVRYNTNGALDNSFGDNGIVLTPIGTSGATLTSTKVQQDGKILAAGHYYNGSNEDFVLIRYNTDGSLDNNFGTNGIVATQVGASYDYAYSMAIQNDGKIILAGSGFQTNDDYALVRYNSDGIIDNSFGINGKVFTQVGTSTDVAKSVLLQDDGKIIAAGYSYNGANYDFSIARYDTNGFLDESFGTIGRTITNIGITNDYAYSAAIKSDGKIVLAGYSYNKNDYDIAIVQYKSDGIIDSSFGTNGIVTTPVGSANDYAYSIAIQNNGNILAAGYSEASMIFNSTGKFTAPNKPSAGIEHNSTLVSYNPDGTLDESFANSGIALSQVGESYTSLSSAAIQSSGKILVAGSFTSPNSLGIARFNSDGTIDNTFLDNGSKSYSPMTSSFSTYTSIKIQNDNKIVLGGYVYFSGQKSSFVISRADSNGNPDPNFGNNGYTITSMDSSVAIQSLAIQNDDKIVAIGNSFSEGEVHFVLARYNTDGNLDNTFGINGIVITPSLTGYKHDYSTSILIQNNSKIIVAGNASNSNENKFALVRYKIDGSVDSSFGNNGIVLTPFENPNVYLNSAALQSDGKIIAAGYIQKSNQFDFVVIKYKADGDVDSTFGINGKIIYGSPNLYAEGESVLIQNDGNIIIAGRLVNDISNTQNIMLMRLTINGGVDQNFGIGGIINTNIGSSYASTSSVLMQSDGKIVVAGNIGNSNFYGALTLIRYNNTPPLPVELISFNASVHDGKVKLNWSTATEVNNLGYEIQRSLRMDTFGEISKVKSPNWEKIGFVEGHGNSTTTISYEFTDTDLNDGSYSYRLKQIDLDGLFEYSKIVEVNLDVPIKFSLSQNYPNPFNPSTKIKYSIPKVGNANLRSLQTSLKVYDILGREVTTLVNENQQPGNYEVEFNASIHSSGVYLYKLTAGSFTATKKMILLR